MTSGPFPSRRPCLPATASRGARHRLLDALALLATVLAVGALHLPSSDEPPALSWQPYSLDSLRAAAGAGKPAVVEVGAAWCAPCAAMERTTFRDPAVIAHARDFALLKADVTTMTADESKRLSRLNVAAVPTIILFDRAGREVRRLVGYTSHTAFVRALEEVASIDTARA